MKRILMTLTLILGFSVAFLWINRTSVVAESGYSARDLSGEYLFNMVEVGIEEDPASGEQVVDYCERVGTLDADGAGTMLYQGTRRCSFSGLETDAATLGYSVDPSGSVLLFVDPGVPTRALHGQIVNHGRGFLFDGTTDSDPLNLIQHGVAMQR